MNGHKTLEAGGKLQTGSSTALCWTRSALNNWLRMPGLTLDTSLALVCIGFSGASCKSKHGLAQGDALAEFHQFLSPARARREINYG